MRRTNKTSLAPWCVFIIDDSPEDRAEVRRMLLSGSERRLRFVEAETAESAIRAVLGTQPLPDCIMLDFYLPDMEAPEVLAALTGADGMPVCPVVVLTGGISREDGRRVLRAGAQDYIGKEWTTPQALSRAIENAVESWAMARELRQRKDALRLITDRETFRSLFSDATRGLTDVHALKRVASHMLGIHLQANRVVYGEIVGEETVVMGPTYFSGVPQLDAPYRLHDFGAILLATFCSGKNVVVHDFRSDAGYSTGEKAEYAKADTVALLVIPILKHDRLVATLGIHQNAPRHWTSEEISIVQEIAERTWSAVEHARTEEKLQAKEVQLSQMLEIMPSFSAVLSGPTFVFQMANQSYFDLVRQGAEIIGKTVLEAFPDTVGEPFPALLEEVYRTGKAFEAKALLLRLPRGDGKTLSDTFVDLAYLPLREADGQVSSIFVHGVDRTAEVRATHELRQRERELRSVTENTPDLLTRFDRNFRHIFVNSVAETLLGVPVTELSGKTHRQLGMPDELCRKWETAIGFVFDHGSDSSLEFSLLTPHQGLRHFMCRVVPEFGEQGQVESALGVTHDITDHQRNEQRLLEQDVRKDEFLATLAHELRNPLAPVRTGLEVLKLTPTPDVGTRILAMMERQLGQLVRLIDDLLDVSRISSGKIMLRYERVALQDIASIALETSRPYIDVAKHTLISDWPDEPVWLDADPTRLSQVFSNLLTNSAKYTREGGRIGFSARRHGTSVIVSVHDTGVGIPADMLSSVFDRFTQVHHAIDRAQGGLGIGLSLVKTLVEMHGGSVTVASGGIDRGSTFTVTLPTASLLRPGLHVAVGETVIPAVSA